MKMYTYQDLIADGWMTLDFRREAVETPKMQSTNAGIIPDRAADVTMPLTQKRAGLFDAGEMAQNVITRVVNYNLDAVVFCGDMSPTLIDNLRLTLDPDIRKGILFLRNQV